MKTVVAAKENIAKLWGHPRPQNKKYRLLKYLLKCEVEDGLLLHNVVTGQLILLTKEEAGSLSDLPEQPTELTQELIADHFLVPEDYDEYRSVKQLRKIYQAQHIGDAITHYVILPTTFCNAHCFYCYESNHPRVHMTEEMANRLVDYMDEQRRGKNISIGWFGGEPLVGIQRIDQITKALKVRDIRFISTMISNGYLFDEDVVKRSVELWNLERVQITLDGTEEVYNKVKAYAGVNESPYQRVIRNIDLLSGHGVQVNIRLNVDFYNKDNILELIEELGKRYSEHEKIAVYLNMLFNDQGYEPVHHSQDEVYKLHKIIEEYTERLAQLKIGHVDYPLPSLQIKQCMADNPHTVMIQPDGSFCRCEHETIADNYGNIDEGVTDPQKPLKWKEIIERSEYCPKCCLYPVCYVLKRCMNAVWPCFENVNSRNQIVYTKLLQDTYKKSLEVEKNESVQ